MNKTFAAHAAPLALAALLSSAMLFATNALAAHQYRVAAATQESTQTVALAPQRVIVIGHRSANT